ncbi:hypothetical protein KJ713_01805 [Patescibacteria group bacterium]|nr:hypothetical protein [Patescibacteria group bacterium]
MFELIKSLIKRKERTNPGVLLSTQVCYQAEEAIGELIVGSKGKFKSVSFKAGRLKIAVGDSIILHRIKMKEEEIIKRVKKKVRIGRFHIYYAPNS